MNAKVKPFSLWESWHNGCVDAANSARIARISSSRNSALSVVLPLEIPSLIGVGQSEQSRATNDMVVYLAIL